MRQIYIAILILVGVKSHSQSISNVTSLQQGSNAVITYDLNGSTGTAYYVRLFYSTDNGQNFSHELAQVAGDVKSGVKTGLGKKIIWAADKEVNYLNGSVVFKVEAESRKSMPKPTVLSGASIEITKAKRTGDEIQIEFLLIQNTEEEVKEYRLLKSSQITYADGKQVNSVSGRLGSKELSYNGDSTLKEDCVKGIPVKGQLFFKSDNNDLVIPAIRIGILNPYSEVNYVVRNIPIE